MRAYQSEFAGLVGTAEVKVTDEDTALHIAARNGHTRVVEHLGQARADLNVQKGNGATPLYLAGQNGHLGVVKALLAHSASVDQAMDDGATPLIVAGQNGHLEVVTALLAHSASVDQARDGGATPLFIAGRNGHLEVVKALLAHSASVDQANGHGTTPLVAAGQDGHLEVATLLYAWGASRQFRGRPVADFMDAVGQQEVARSLRATAGWGRFRYAHDVAAAVGGEAGVAWVQRMLRAGHPLDQAAQAAAGACTCAACRRVVDGAAAWRADTHGLFPAAARAEAKRVLLLAHQLGRVVGLPGQHLSLLLIPLVVTR
jgi:hypothetical protein